MSLVIPERYKLKLLPETTEIAIKEIKDFFEKELSEALNLRRVTAPLFVEAGTGINDDLNGVETPVSFTVKDAGGVKAEIVQSLAKWKRVKLADYEIAPGFGIYTDMNAIRPDEQLDNLHSLYVDQWDWEKAIRSVDRTVEYLKETVEKIYGAIVATEQMIYRRFPHITPTLPSQITFIHAEELRRRYPELSPKEREEKFVRETGAAFVIGIGGRLGDGKPHDGRAPDYDDWTTVDSETGLAGLNGDILVWDRVLDCVMELSSMGIRVDGESMKRQLEIAGCTDRARLEFHHRLLAGELPLSIGGGIGQSRLCMFILQKAHIGEVQASIWPKEQAEALAKANVPLL